MTDVYGKEGRLNSKFLVHTKAALKSIAQVTNELNQSFPLPTDVTGSGISRVAAYLHLLHHQVCRFYSRSYIVSLNLKSV